MTAKSRQVVCYFWCEDSDWVGQSMLYDLRVDADDLAQAKVLLGESISIFVDEALASETRDSRRLLRRHAPLSVMLECWIRFAIVRLSQLGGHVKIDRWRFPAAEPMPAA